MKSEYPLWRPNAGRCQSAQITEFTLRANALAEKPLVSYADLHAWSIEQPQLFWKAIWEDFGVIGEMGQRTLLEAEEMYGARWFPDARLNYAENLLRDSSNEPALVFWGEDKVKRHLSRIQLRRQVAELASALRSVGIVAGDCVAAYMPNMPETIVVMLASASIGAVFTSASPDFGVRGVLDRFGQTRPKVLFACDGYWYNGQAVDVMPRLAEIAAGLPTVAQLILVPYLGAVGGIDALPNAVTLERFIAPHESVEDIHFARLPFDHPLYIMYSSGTTGVPKCIAHGAGGTLLQHLKEHRLHCDVRQGDSLFYFTTCGWMMWNWLASGLASGARLLLYDGSPFAAGGRILWEYAQAERMSHFGTSAKYIDALAKTEIIPLSDYNLAALRVVLSTGSPLAPESFAYVYSNVKKDVQLSSISGGTDIISCFVLGNPTLPVWQGEIQCKGLGMAVEVWNEHGVSVRGEKGELVCTKPFPSMPIGFWNDPTGEKYRAAYFEHYPGVWCHGDYCEITAHEGLIIHGRSDATLNPGGVRIGTAEIYRQVETLREIVESVVIGQNFGGDVRVVLFVKLREGLFLDDELTGRIKQSIRDSTTPRHVPARVLQVADIPRTKSGKIVELAVRNVVHRISVLNIEALANPEALSLFADRRELED